MQITDITLEICVESVDGALTAERGGADRIELCSSLTEGGITPSIGLITKILEKCRLPVMVMVRPREGSFVYTDHEFDVMLEDVKRIRPLGVEGIVTGILGEGGEVDIERCTQLTEAAYPLSCTFHRAVDVSIDPFDALEVIIDCGFDRVLTSGQQPGALQGADMIRQLVERSKGRISVMPGAGVRAENVVELLHQTGAREVHSSASVWVSDYRSTPARDPLGRRETSIDLVRALRAQITDYLTEAVS